MIAGHLIRGHSRLILNQENLSVKSWIDPQKLFEQIFSLCYFYGKNMYLVWIKKYMQLISFFLFFFFLFILPYALADILGRLAQRLLVQDSKKARIIVQRFKSIKMKDETDDRLKS